MHGQLLSDIQSKSNTLRVDSLVFLDHLAEDFEQVLLILGTDAYACVVDFKLHPWPDRSRINHAVGSCRKRSRSYNKMYKALESELGWVTQQVDKDLLQALQVGIHGYRHILCDVFHEEDQLFLEVDLYSYEVYHVKNKLTDVDFVEVGCELPRLQLR